MISGSCVWDVGVSAVQIMQEEEYGRTISITSNKSSVSYAVQSFLTGNLANTLSSYGYASDPDWFLNGNGFGTPYIPDSSMSLGNVSPEQIDASASAEIWKQTVGQTTLIPNANTMTDFLNREGYSQTTEQLWLNAIASGSA